MSGVKRLAECWTAQALGELGEDLGLRVLGFRLIRFLGFRI